MSELSLQLQRSGSPRLLVVGDVILDRYVCGDATRVSPEAPVVVLRADHDEICLGGAASAAFLLRGLGAEVTLAGVVGDDADGRLVRRLLADSRIADALVVDATRPTTSKERVMGRAAGRQPHQIARIDREDCRAIADGPARQLAAAVEQALPECRAVLVSDYAKGVCTPGLLREIATAAPAAAVPWIVDPGRLADYSRYAGAALVKPNRAEAELAAGMRVATPGDALAAAERIAQRFQLSSVLVTLDADGMALVDRHGASDHFPTSPRSVSDITGAGDMVLAVLGLCFAAGMAAADAARLANVAAGLEVERLGIAQVSRAEIIAALRGRAPLAPGRRASAGKLASPDELAEQAAAHRAAGKRVAFTNGCFDLLHVGHVRYLEEAAALAEALFVAVNSDASVARLKGAGRPVVGQNDRAAMLAALQCVDHVTIFDADTPHELLRRLRPDVLVKGGTYAPSEVVGREIVESYGGAVRVVGAVPDVSTTQMIRRIAHANGAAADGAPRRAGIEHAAGGGNRWS